MSYFEEFESKSLLVFCAYPSRSGSTSLHRPTAPTGQSETRVPICLLLVTSTHCNQQEQRPDCGTAGLLRAPDTPGELTPTHTHPKSRRKRRLKMDECSFVHHHYFHLIHFTESVTLSVQQVASRLGKLAQFTQLVDEVSN